MFLLEVSLVSVQPETPQFDFEQLSRLVNLYCQHDKEEDAEVNGTALERTRLLRDLLSEVLPLSPSVIEALPVILQRLHREMPRLQGRSLLALLQDPGTPLRHLRAIKEYAKEKTVAAETEAQYEAAGVVYYGAMAAALLSHDRRISRHSLRQLQESFVALNTKEWIVSELRLLFERAAEHRPGTANSANEDDV